MSRPPTPEEAFRSGADAMRSKLVALLMLQGKVDLATQMLQVSCPPFQMPERYTVGPSDASGLT